MTPASSFFRLILIAGLLSVAAVGHAQKEIGDECISNDECKTSHCVVLKDASKMKCSSCDQDQLAKLTETVTQKCKGWYEGTLSSSDVEREFGSKNEIGLVDALGKLEICKACFEARSDREKSCWDGGDQAHRDEITKVEKTKDYLARLIDEKKRDGLAYNCQTEEYQHTLEDIQKQCEKVDELFEKFGHDNDDPVEESALRDLVDKCQDCREVYAHMVNECFRIGASDQRKNRLKQIQDMEEISKKTLSSKESRHLFK